jgi:GH15 family glucan-1,4-alpha-glucosidase
MDTDGYAPIRDHAAIGDGRTIALVAIDGSIDWLCLPDLDSPSVFGSLLDAGTGGAFTLAPDVPFESTRRYVEGTNVLVTEFTTSTGAVRLTDAMTLPGGGLDPYRELARKVDVVWGHVPMRWSVTPAFGYGRERVRIGERHGVPVASAGNLAIAVNAWEVGQPKLGLSSIKGRFVARGDSMIAMSVASQEPLVLPSRADVERRLEETADFWRAWTGTCADDGAWRDAVVRSALALKLLVFAPSGAVAAAATTSLPEEIGGERNWDYRFCWLRDSAFTVASFLRLGYVEEADAFFWWLMHASQLTHPRLDVLYGLHGEIGTEETQLSLAGYRGSVPVRIGNDALGQVQLDIYGSLLQAAWVYVQAGRPIDDEVARRLARTADLVCDIWAEPDSGIWEVRSEPRHFTHSKMMCWVALDRAIRLANQGHIRGSIDRWSSQMQKIESFIESRCWSDACSSYVRSAGSDELDAAVLLGALLGYRDPGDPRMASTIDAIRRDLGRGPFLDRYRGVDGVRGSEGAFLACSFWLVEALARSGRRSEAASLMGELVSAANDVGLYAEEIDPSTAEFLGNFPQALSHLALIGAAAALDDADVP